MKRLSNQHCATTERRLILRVFNLILSYWILCDLKVDERKGIKKKRFLWRCTNIGAWKQVCCYSVVTKPFVDFKMAGEINKYCMSC